WVQFTDLGKGHVRLRRKLRRGSGQISRTARRAASIGYRQRHARAACKVRYRSQTARCGDKARADNRRRWTYAYSNRTWTRWATTYTSRSSQAEAISWKRRA